MIGLRDKIVLFSQLWCVLVSSVITRVYRKKTHFINDFVLRSPNLDTHLKHLVTLLVTMLMG